MTIFPNKAVDIHMTWIHSLHEASVLDTVEENTA